MSGEKRPSGNLTTHFAFPEHSVFAVFEAMGAPDLALQAERIAGEILQRASGKDLVSSIVDLNGRIYEAVKQEFPSKMLLCSVLATTVDEHVAVAHCGNCAAYAVTKSEYTRIAVPHRAALEAFRTSESVEEYLQMRILSRVVTWGVGNSPRVRVDFTLRSIDRPVQVWLCTNESEPFVREFVGKHADRDGRELVANWDQAKDHSRGVILCVEAS